MADTRNNVYVSAASVWEIAIKRRTGKLVFHGMAASAISANGFLELPIGSADAEQAGGLAWQHGDPFDRMLVAQAMRAGLVIVTSDRSIQAYDQVAHMAADRMTP